MKLHRRLMTLTTARQTLGDDLPCADRHDYASAQWLWQPDTQPPSEWDGAEEGDICED